jgi:hypothetical protein
MKSSVTTNKYTKRLTENSSINARTLLDCHLNVIWKSVTHFGGLYAIIGK